MTENITEKIALVVDDTALVRQAVGKVVSKAGYKVVGAGDGSEAIHKARFHEPDLIVLDVEMPKMSGIDVLRLLRKEDRFTDVPVIMLTGTADKEVVKAVLTLHVEDYILKDDATNILTRLQEILERMA